MRDNTEHRVEWGMYGWACSCGAGREWSLSYGTGGTVARAKAAAHRHQFSEWRKANGPKGATDQQLTDYVAKHVHRWGPLGSMICQECGAARRSAS